MLKRLLPIEARRRAYNNVTSRWRSSELGHCKVNSFSLQMRDQFEYEVSKCTEEKLLELADEQWWPTEFIVWLLHGLPCDDKNNQFIKISDTKLYEGRRMKRNKLKQDFELNTDNSSMSNSEVSNKTFTHILTRPKCVSKLRSEYCSISAELIEAHLSLPSVESNPMVKSILLSRIEMLVEHLDDLKRNIAIEDNKNVAIDKIVEKENTIPKSRIVRLRKPQDLSNIVTTPISTFCSTLNDIPVNTEISQLTDSQDDYL